MTDECNEPALHVKFKPQLYNSNDMFGKEKSYCSLVYGVLYKTCCKRNLDIHVWVCGRVNLGLLLPFLNGIVKSIIRKELSVFKL